MLKPPFLTCDRCGLRANLLHVDPVRQAGWLRHPQLGDYCEPRKERVLA